MRYQHFDVVERYSNVGFQSQDSENEGFGVVGCVQGCKTGFKAFL